MFQEQIRINTRYEIQAQLADLQSALGSLALNQRTKANTNPDHSEDHIETAEQFEAFSSKLEKIVKELDCPDCLEPKEYLRYVGSYRNDPENPGRQVSIARYGADGDFTTYDLPPRNELRNHSPTGFSWGYPGSGPAQLALAILSHHTDNDEYALRNYQNFKTEVITKISTNHWTMDNAQVQGWVEDNP